MKKVDVKEVGKNTGKKFKKGASDFKDFISRGNVVDMAVAVVIGAAFGKIVTSLVNDIIMPLVGVIIGGIDFTGLTLQVKDATVNYGVFIQSIVDFLIIAFCIFLVVKLFEKFKRKEEVVEVKEEPKKSEEVLLLEEIRDLLKKKTK